MWWVTIFQLLGGIAKGMITQWFSRDPEKARLQDAVKTLKDDEKILAAPARDKSAILARMREQPD